MDDTIVLTGPKHSGKTTAGKALAQLCSCDFIDLDDLIEQRTGKSPRQLYCGNPAEFQKAETEALSVLVKLSEPGRRVIAAGGGIIDNPDAATMLKISGALIVCLNTSADCAWNRIAGKTSLANSPDGELPPFLNTENPRETHRVLHERRAAAYSLLANIIIEAEGKTPEEIAAEIFNRMRCV